MQQSEAALAGQTERIPPKPAGAAHFFMSANTPSGFVSRFNELYSAAGGWRAYILKSAPGVAPGLLPSAGEALEAAGETVEYIHCVSDPGGVSALVLPRRKVSVLDGMPPHLLSAEFPGVVEDEIPLCGLDAAKLAPQRGRILQFAARAATQYDRAYRFLSAVSSLQADTFRIAAENVDAEAVEKYATGLAKRLFIPRGKEGDGTVTRRFLTGVTARGPVSYADSVLASYNKVYLLEDDAGIGALLLTALRVKAVASGQDVVACDSALLPDHPEHLLLPGLSVAFLTSGRFFRIESRACRHISVKRFVNCETLRFKKARLGFDRKASRELLGQAVLLLAEAQSDDAVVRECYLPAVDLACARAGLDALVRRLTASPARPA